MAGFSIRDGLLVSLDGRIITGTTITVLLYNNANTKHLLAIYNSGEEMMPSMIRIFEFFTGLKMLTLVRLAVTWVNAGVISIHKETVLI